MDRMSSGWRRRLAPVVMAAAVLAASACSGGDLLDPGRMENGAFVHEGLGLRLPVPADWVVLEDMADGETTRTGRDLLSGGDPTGGAYADASAPTSRTLLQIKRYPLGTVPGMNPGIVVAVENITARPEVQSSVDYLQMLQSFMEKGGASITFEPIVPEAELGGQVFAVLALTLQPAPNVAIGQIYHVRRVQDVVLTLVATFQTPQQWAELEAVLNGLSMEQ